MGWGSTPLLSANKYTMIFYKTIDIVNYDTVIKKCLEYVRSIDRIFNRRLPNASWYNLNLTELQKFCPELTIAFQQLDLKIVMAAAYVMYAPNHTSVHVDSYPAQARINLPLLNCDKTYTNFYTSDCDPVEWINPDSGVKSYVSSVNSLVDRVEIKQATVIRTKVPHSVDLPKGSLVPRITLTLGFNRDPVYLLE